MLNSSMLLSAMSGIEDEYILKTDKMLCYSVAESKKRSLSPRTLLIAAVIAGLLSAAAFAASYWGRKDRSEVLPPDAAGYERQIIIPNGFKESPTYKGSLEWWIYLDGAEKPGEGFDFAAGQEEYSIAKIYTADSREKLDKLLSIADKYGLKLYTSEMRVENKAEFEAATGLVAFPGTENISGYIFADGSFKIELELKEKLFRSCNMTRIMSGSIYPYGGAGRAVPLKEEEYLTDKGQNVSIGQGSGAGVISYLSKDGETFIELNFSAYSFEGSDAAESMKRIADSIDFEALCRPMPCLSEKKAEGHELIKAFEESPAYMAAEKFNAFFSENFVNPCFTGTYGMEGYGDIDRELERLAAEYSLSFARTVTEGNEFYPQARCYDNGAWYAEISGPENMRLKLHFIPKDALYTGLSNFTAPDSYAFVRSYKAADGSLLLLLSGGPDKQGPPFALYDSGRAFVLLYMSSEMEREMQRAADSIDWEALK